MADGLRVGDGNAPATQGAWLAGVGAEAAAVRTGQLVGEGVGLLFQEGGEDALGQAAGGGVRDLLEGGEVEVQAGAGLAEGLAGDRFSPAGGPVVDFLELLG